MPPRRCPGWTLFLVLLAAGCADALPQTSTPPSTGSSSSRQSSPSAKSSKNNPTAPDLGSVHEQLYRNRTFGFSYKIPFGWVQRTDDMRQTSTEKDKSLVLLAAFERPPEAMGESVNSAVVVTAESVSAYPDLDRAVDYFDVLDEITSSKGFKVLNPPYEFPVGQKKLARGDYVKRVAEGVDMYQASLVLIEQGFVLSFTFIADSEDELESLIMELQFTSRPKPRMSVEPR